MKKVDLILKNLIENLEEGIHIIDDKGKTIYYNEAMAKLEGQKRESVIGKKVTEYLSGVNEENSTLLSSLKHKKKFKGVIQEYKNKTNKNITTINTSIPVLKDGECIAAVEIAKDMTALRKLNEKICKLESKNSSKKSKYLFKDIIGNSEGMRKVVNKAMRASLSNSSVLIYGETGSGKEVIAQSIHYNGIRRDAPFIAVNCAAIPSALLESMFFGTVKGSFTGSENKKGLFEEANKGTILLDELNSLEPYLQSKLLRVLQEGYIMPLGSSKIIDVDVRIIATLNEKPEKLIESGKLRKDFYYRLGVIRIDVPPLRERKNDIEELVQQFIAYYNRIIEKEVVGVKEEVLEKFMQYNWPGNVRELKNVIESAMNMCDNYCKLGMDCFEHKFMKENEEDNILLGEKSLNELIEDIEKKIILKNLRSNGYNISKTAEILKVKRQVLQYKMKKYAIKRE